MLYLAGHQLRSLAYLVILCRHLGSYHIYLYVESGGYPGGSPFVLTFQNLGIPVVAGLFNLVVLPVALSAINSYVFGVWRMLHDMRVAGACAVHLLVRIASRHSLDGDDGDAGDGLFELPMPENVFLMIAALATFATV